MLRVMTIVGTRPEIVKLSRVISELDRYTDHVLVHTGQNYDYELNQIFFDQLQIRPPDVYLNSVGETTARTIGNIIANADQCMAERKPDAVLVYGDTNSCLSVVAAKRRRIPVFHMEAGNRCFDQRVPEEINRKIVDHAADINLTLTEHARRYLLREGLPPETVFKVGSSMKEVLAYYLEGINASTVLQSLGVEPGKYFVISAHREENVDVLANLESLIATVNRLSTDFRLPLIFSAHPRTMKRLEGKMASLDPLVRVVKPFGFLDYLKLQSEAFCVASDSGTITEESSILGFPAVTIRNTHERPEGMDAGSLVMTGLHAEDVSEAVRVVTEQFARGYRPAIPPDYDVDGVSKKVVRIILSYTRYVNATVWRQ